MSLVTIRLRREVVRADHTPVQAQDPAAAVAAQRTAAEDHHRMAAVDHRRMAAVEEALLRTVAEADIANHTPALIASGGKPKVWSTNIGKSDGKTNRRSFCFQE